MNTPGSLIWAITAGLLAIYIVAACSLFRNRLEASRTFGIGLLAIFAALIFSAEPVTANYSPRTTVTGRVESVTATSGDWRRRKRAALVLDLGDRAYITLSYDPAQETFNATQVIHVTYTDWDDHIRVVHPLWRPDSEVLSEERDPDSPYRLAEIILAALIGIVCITLSAKKPRDLPASTEN